LRHIASGIAADLSKPKPASQQIAEFDVGTTTKCQPIEVIKCCLRIKPKMIRISVLLSAVLASLQGFRTGKLEAPTYQSIVSTYQTDDYRNRAQELEASVLSKV
jgi:hypothetical protein